MGEREKALAAGMGDYLTKPLNTKVLREALERWWPRDSMWPCQPDGASVPRAAQAPDEGTLDPTVSRSQGVVRVFLRHVPEQLASLTNAVENDDLGALRAAAHKLRGSCVSVGVPRMAALCQNLESALAVQGAPELTAQLGAEFARVREKLTLLLPLPSA